MDGCLSGQKDWAVNSASYDFVGSNPTPSTMNSRQKGDVAVADAIAWYVNRGCIVSFPMTEASRYDLIVDNGKLLRVQCKSTTQQNKSGVFECDLRTHGGNQSWNKVHKKISASECDIVFIRTADGTRYAIPASKVEGKSTIYLGSKWTNYKL